MRVTRMATILATAAVLGLAGCAASPGERSTGQVLDDSVITARVKTALAQEAKVSAMDVNVTTYRGVVQLSGFVDSEAEARRAVEAARDVTGVRSVDSALQVAPEKR